LRLLIHGDERGRKEKKEKERRFSDSSNNDEDAYSASSPVDTDDID